VYKEAFYTYIQPILAHALGALLMMRSSHSNLEFGIEHRPGIKKWLEKRGNNGIDRGEGGRETPLKSIENGALLSLCHGNLFRNR